MSMQSVSTIIFLYFANLAPIVAFGGLLGDATDNRMASIEALVSFLWSCRVGIDSANAVSSILFVFILMFGVLFSALRLW